MTVAALSRHPITRGRSPRTTTRSQLARLAGWAVVVVIVATWIVVLRPELLGGPATYLIVSGESMEPTLHAGQLVVARRQNTYRRGDVIAYRIMKNHAGAGALVIHRIVGGSSQDGYITRGDNRAYRDPWRPRPADIAGKMKLRVPHLGMLAVFSHTPFGMALIAGLAGLLVLRGGTNTRADGPAPGSEELDPVLARLAQDWGEALWTAPDLSKGSLERELEVAAVRRKLATMIGEGEPARGLLRGRSSRSGPAKTKTPL